MSALHLAKNSVFHARMKLIELDYHFVREKVIQGQLITKHVPSPLQIADVFTKPLNKHLFGIFRNKLEVHYMTLPSLIGMQALNLIKICQNQATTRYTLHGRNHASNHVVVTPLPFICIEISVYKVL